MSIFWQITYSERLIELVKEARVFEQMGCNIPSKVKAAVQDLASLRRKGPNCWALPARWPDGKPALARDARSLWGMNGRMHD